MEQIARSIGAAAEYKRTRTQAILSVFANGIYGLRFECTATATGSRNKGRLSIDDMVFGTRTGMSENQFYITNYRKHLHNLEFGMKYKRTKLLTLFANAMALISCNGGLSNKTFVEVGLISITAHLVQQVRLDWLLKRKRAILKCNL